MDVFANDICHPTSLSSMNYVIKRRVQDICNYHNNCRIVCNCVCSCNTRMQSWILYSTNHPFAIGHFVLCASNISRTENPVLPAFNSCFPTVSSFKISNAASYCLYHWKHIYSNPPGMITRPVVEVPFCFDENVDSENEASVSNREIVS